MQKTEIAFWRTFLGIKTKKGYLPTVNLSRPTDPKGRYSDSHPQHDNGVGFTFHHDGSCSMDISNESIIRDIISGSRNHLRFVMTPKVLEQLGRFLCKIGVELICRIDPGHARSDVFQQARLYARKGTMSDLWPIFYYSSGQICNLIRRIDDENEQIDCYSFSLLDIPPHYIALDLKIGTSHWVICLNDQWPTPDIKIAFPDKDLKLLWYNQESLRRYRAPS